MFQVFRRGCSVDNVDCAVRSGPASIPCSAEISVSFSFLSLDIKSKPEAEPVPGVFGVFADPKDANAPLPKPNAEDALAEGDFVPDGDRVLKGLVFPCDEVSPKRLLV